VRHSLPASVALFSLSLLALPSAFLVTSHAQQGVPPTGVTSQGFGGSHPITAPFPSGGTLPGHVAPAQGGRVTFSTSNPNSANSNPSGGHHQHHRDGAPLLYAFPVPYVVDPGMAATDSAEDGDDNDANYQGGPTIFDRRGSGAASYVPPQRYSPSPAAAPAENSEPEPAAEPTLLVFKDGHKLEVGNYAIVGVTLFDLTPGHSRKVALADLDLPATQKQNDDRGVNFQVPPIPQAN
jgi:hypothetical protein